jgi:hypothetical protein
VSHWNSEILECFYMTACMFKLFCLVTQFLYNLLYNRNFYNNYDNILYKMDYNLDRYSFIFGVKTVSHTK